MMIGADIRMKASGLSSPTGFAHLACDEQPVFLCRVRDLHLDPLRDELLGVVDARDALIELLERFEGPFFALRHDPPHRLLANARQHFEHLESSRYRLR